MSYRLRFRVKGQREQLTATFLGSLSEAREHARDYIAEARLGKDPRPRPAAAPLTLVRVAALWVKGNRRRWRRSTTRFYLALLRRRVLPTMATRDPRDITRAELRDLLDRIAAKHTTEANRVYATLRALYSWLNKARQERIGVTADPTRGLEKPGREQPRSATYHDAELARFMTAGPDLVRFLALTGVREGEARGLTFDEVDFDRAVWTIPGTRTKNGKPHQVPLSGAAAAILTGARAAFLVRPWVKTRPTKVYKALGLRPHDLRRTVGDHIRGEFGESMMHGILGHSEARITSTYGPTPRLEAIRSALEWWAGALRRSGVV